MPYTKSGIPHVGKPTSKAAAQSMQQKAPVLRALVLQEIHHSTDGLTDQEVQDSLDLGPQTQTPRRIELERVGLVEDSGRVRPTRSGRKAIVWVTTFRVTQDVLDTGDLSDFSPLPKYQAPRKRLWEKSSDED